VKKAAHDGGVARPAGVSGVKRRLKETAKKTAKKCQPVIERKKKKSFSRAYLCLRKSRAK
jgi:hypothetical protein